ncbi:hypothetical protein J3R83DRAFT_12222 [Lanmaoa asiatica]|nr:hypothetical protein J3R83DRAFT_12222 [Lanmaoa asiatica]
MHLSSHPTPNISPMNNIPSSPTSAVPSIRIHDADDASALFDGGEMFPTDIYKPIQLHPQNAIPQSPAELEDIPELSHLTTTFLTGHRYSLPYPTILQENGTTPADLGLSPSSLGSSIPSPTPSFGSSLSPSSLYDSLAFSDNESLISPSPTSSDGQIFWPPQGLNHQSSDPLVSQPFLGSFNDPLPPSSVGPHRSRSPLSPSRPGPVASKAMLEANSRRRRHPPQFECPKCKQTFTALFSLKRHGQSHTGERPFACCIPGCTQRFFNSSDCKRHEKSKKRHKDLLMQ